MNTYEQPMGATKKVAYLLVTLLVALLFILVGMRAPIQAQALEGDYGVDNYYIWGDEDGVTPGGTLNLFVDQYPWDGVDYSTSDFIWTSSNTSVATVALDEEVWFNPPAVVTGRAYGTAVISIAKTNNPSQRIASITVNVSDPYVRINWPIWAIDPDTPPNNNKEATLIFKPDTGSDGMWIGYVGAVWNISDWQDLEISCNNKDFSCKFDSPTKTYEIIANKPGTAVFTLSVEDGQGKTYSDSFTLNVLPSIPTLTSATASASSVTVKWTKVAGVDGYYLYRKAGTTTVWAKIATVAASATSYADTKISGCTKYTYTLSAYRGSLEGSFDPVGISATFVATPTLTSATASASSITVKWQKVAGIDGYYLYRKAGTATAWTKIATVAASATSYADTKVSGCTKYTYTLSAFKGATESGKNTTGVSATFVATPALKSVANGNGNTKLTWAKVAGVDGYKVYRKAGTATSWSLLATVKGAATLSYTTKSVTSGTAYRYTVRAYKGTTLSGYNTSGLYIRYLAVPKLGSAIRLKKGSNSIKVTFSGVTNASGYYIYRKTTGGWVKVASVGSKVRSWTDTKTKKGTKYTYTVRAWNKTGTVTSLSAYNTTGVSFKP